MPTVSLNLIISVKSGRDLQGIGGVFGLPALIFNVPGGPWQPLVHGDSVTSDMVIGDELKEAVFRRKLQILRDGDAHSIDLYQAYQQHKKFLIIANVFSKSGGGGTTNATLTITDASMFQFNRKKIAGVGGMISGAHRDDMKFSFDSSNTKIEYGRDINAVAAEVFGKVTTAIGKSGK